MVTGHAKGFTLIELLVVISIIGVLSSLVIAALSESRGKARTASAHTSLKSLQAGFLLCMNTNTAIAIPTETNAGGGLAVCAGSPTSYVQLPAGWIYCNASPSEAQGVSGCGDEVSTQSSGISFNIVAESNADRAIVTCAVNGCTVNTTESPWD